MTISKFDEKVNKSIESIVDGVFQIEISNWLEFNEFVYGNLLDQNHYIWRGQRSSNWLLEPTLDRILKDKDNKEELVRNHLETFKYATRGRRGNNPLLLNSESEWWAVGQHYGLATPLLDWTTSPFVAAFFAFSEESDKDEYRAIYVLNQSNIEVKCTELSKDPKENDNLIQFIKPFSDDNHRLVNQSGLFTWGPMNVDIETLVKKYYLGVVDKARLIKIVIRNSERLTILKALNRMNINHLTLFPDLIGASLFSNMNISISNY
ncbi:FRG domain-containing protein [Paenibacillus sp. KN14-4R]|uniref:FRG domain-containing protein n=1 Tax=Paenibacillus sp. KN14-4R TaxID=3445773 RepID=UPI003FA0052A